MKTSRPSRRGTIRVSGRLWCPQRAPLRAGMTLLELTVVILVLLSLIVITVIGARAWKRGSDRALCITRLRSVQQGVRGFCNLYGYNPGVSVPGLQSLVIGSGRFVEAMPGCPAGGDYSTLGDQIPSIGTLYMTCSLAATNQHEPTQYADW